MPQQHVVGVGNAEALNYEHEAYYAQQPADEVRGAAGGNECPNACVHQQRYTEELIQARVATVGDRGSKEIEQPREREKHHGECPYRPGQPSSSTVAHPPYSSSTLLFPCPFRHNPILQHYRLPSVTKCVTRDNVQPTSPTPR